MVVPGYSVSIQPHCDSEGLCRLSISLTLESPAIKAHAVLCEFAADVQGIPTHNYTKENLYAQDAAGPLNLYLVPRGVVTASSGHVWAVDRDTVGPVTLQLEVLPRLVDAKTPVGPPVDLLRDQGGLLGSGGWFLPSILYQERFLFTVQWDLSRVAVGTRACWSYGEGPGRAEQEGPLPLLLNSIFMVGPVNSQRAEHGSAASTVYWFGDLPDYLEPVKDFSQHMVPNAYAAFEDDMENYSIFIRKSLKGYSGHNFASSLLLQYSDERGRVDDADLISILTHELVHNWLYLGSKPGESQNMWYIEGVAQFYALFLPVRAGFRGADYFCAVMNKFLCAYYTNSLINTSLLETETELYGDPRAQWTPYMRGFVYLLLVDASLRQASSATSQKQNPIDDVFMSLTRQNRQGEQATSSTWLETLYPLLGKEVVDKQYETLVNGGTLHLSSDSTFPVAEYLFMLRAVEQEVFELGFNATSLHSGVVEGVVPGSRAALAGLQDGDEIQHCSRVSMALMDIEETISFSVTRFGQDKLMRGEIRPRSSDKVCSFRVVRVDHSAALLG